MVQKDEFEEAERKLIEFWTYLGHAVETKFSIPHGHAVSIGINGLLISEDLPDLNKRTVCLTVLKKYGLPIEMKVDKKEVLSLENG